MSIRFYIYLAMLICSTSFVYYIQGLAFSVLFFVSVISIYIYSVQREYLGVVRSIENYISNYSIVDENKKKLPSGIEGIFFFRKLYCDGYVDIDVKTGISLYFEKRVLLIPWQYVKSITLLEFKGINAARLFLDKNGEVKDELYIPWDNRFNENISLETVFLDSR